MKIKKKARLTIQNKLTYPYMVLAILIALAGGFVITKIVLGSVEERFLNQLIESRKLASEFMVREENLLLDSLRLISFVDGLSSSISENDVDGLHNIILPIAFNFDLDAIVLLDKKGGFITSFIKSEEKDNYSLFDFNLDFVEYSFVNNIILQKIETAGDKYAGVLYSDLGYYLFISGPIYNESGSLVGILLVGEPINKITNKLYQETLSHASIYNLENQLISSTLKDIPPVDDNDISVLLDNQNSQSLFRNFKSSNNKYSELLGTWEVRGGEDIGILGTSLPNNFLFNTSTISRVNISIIVGLAISLTLLLGIYLSRKITEPILSLKKAAANVENGDLSVNIEVVSNDEISDLANSFNKMVSSLNYSEKNLLAAYEMTMEGWAKALELRNADTQGHSDRVTDLTMRLVGKLGINGNELIHIRRGALLHDIGKLAIPDKILLKEGVLNKEERAIIEKHPDYAKEMIGQIEYLEESLDIPYCHHEKWDGTGYPRGLIGEEIPLSARIFALVDVWDALVSDRPYRKAMDSKKALSIISDGSGKHFDPSMVKVFLKLILEDSLAYEKGSNKTNKENKHKKLTHFQRLLKGV